MKRWVWRVLLFLLIGAVVNVAVAWGCVARLEFSRVAPFDARDWPNAVPDDWPLLSLAHESNKEGLRYSGLGRQEIAVMARFDPPPPLASAPARYFQTDAAGWPMPALATIDAFDVDIDATPQQVVERIPVGWRRGLWLRGSPAGLPKRSDLRLPLYPMWPGFALNTLLYAILFSAWGTARQIRMAWRIRHSLCPHCAYPTGTSPVCTECGKPVKLRTGAAA